MSDERESKVQAILGRIGLGADEIIGYEIMRAWQLGAAAGTANVSASRRAKELLLFDELLAALKRYVDLDDMNCLDYAHDADECAEAHSRARALIARIEGK